MSANLFSSYTFGYLSDKIGRKKSTQIALLMVAGGVIISSFMPEYISFCVLRFITGFGMNILLRHLRLCNGYKATNS